MIKNNAVKAQVTDVEFVINVDVTADVYFERPAPFTMNHDSPAFSDPGDPAEVDNLQVTLDVSSMAKRDREYIAKRLVEDGVLELTEVLEPRQLQDCEDAAYDSVC